MNFYYIAQALNVLVPNCAFGCGDTYDSIEWYSTNTEPLPTEQEVVEKVAELTYLGELNSYQESRKLEYPPIEDQLDKIYHHGVDAWKVDIKAVKDRHPKQTIDATELKKRKDDAIFEMHKKNYKIATERLAQYELSAGLKDETYTTEVTGETTTTTQDINTPYIIEPLPISIEIDDGFKKEYIRNPLVVQDEAERKAAQEVINKTPQAVIDSINT